MSNSDLTIVPVRTDQAKVPGLAAAGESRSTCRSFDMPTSQIFALRERSSNTVAWAGSL